MRKLVSLVVALISLPVGSAEAAVEPARVVEVLEGERGSEPETFEAFSILAVNTNEQIEVHMVAGHPTEASRQAISHAFRCLRTEREAEIDAGLVRLLFELARQIQQPLELVSAYRAPHPGKRTLNYHERAQAADIRVKGVPHRVLFDLARRMNIPGLGIYPASGMIHIDVRATPYHWLDYSPPWHPRADRRP